MSSYRVGFVGAGQMATALMKGFLEAGLARPEDISISDVKTETLEKLVNDFGVVPVASNRDVVERAEVVILAVKPQQLPQVLDELAESVTPEKIVVSIAAGITTQKISSKLPAGSRVVRVMPNTPALVGESASVVSPGEGADREAVNTALELFGAVGQVAELPEEFQNRVTAISGSGPAYFFYLVEAIIGAAEKIGLAEDVAKRLVVQTMVGSAKILVETNREPGELRKMVTSPGGTTEAAIGILDEADVRGIVGRAVEAAVNRAEELAR